MNKYIGLEKIISYDRIKYDESMKKYTTVKVGGNADVIVFPNSTDEIVSIIKYCNENKINFYVIGNGSNLLVKDEGIRGVVIKLGHRFSDIKVDGNKITALSGAMMPAISIAAKKESLEGFEFACGIPGTIGGGIKMNAGAYGYDISNTIESVTYLDDGYNIKTIKNQDCMFGYRESIFLNNPKYVILSGTFNLKKGKILEIEKKMIENSEARKMKQPLEYPNFGSVFKRPEGYFVGKLVDDAGLRGYKIGGAQVSTKHSGFIVNIDNATCKDILDLIEYIQKIVFEKFKVKLTTEVVVLGGEQ